MVSLADAAFDREGFSGSALYSSCLFMRRTRRYQRNKGCTAACNWLRPRIRKAKSSTLFNGCRDCRTGAAIFHANARNFANDENGYRTVKIAVALWRTIALVRNFDPGIVWPVTLDQREQCRGMRGTQPDVAMRRRAAEPDQLIGAVNGKAAIKEDRVRHRRTVMAPLALAAATILTRRGADGFAGAALRKSSNCDWRAISPAPEFRATLGARVIQ
jgi:hypothetical protein